MCRTDVSEKFLSLLEKECPESTEAERIRFLKATSGSDGVPQLEIAAQSLHEYLDWHARHSKSDAEEEKSDALCWQEAWKLALSEAQEDDGSFKGQDEKEQATSILEAVNRLRTVIQHVDSNGNPVKAKDGTLLLHMMPGQIDKQLASNEMYVQIFARYVDFKFDRHSQDQQATLLFDVRPGVGWGNHPALTLLPLIREATHDINRLFPGRLHRILLYPISPILRAVWSVAKTFMHKETADRVTLIGGTDGFYSMPPNKALSEYVDDSVLAEAEKVRLASFQED